MKHQTTIGIALSLALGGCAVPAPTAVSAAASAPTRYLVTLSDPAAHDRVVQQLTARGATVSADLEALGVLAVEGPDPALAAPVDGVAGSAPVRRRDMLGKVVAQAAAADPDFPLPPMPGSGGEPFSGYQWGLDVGHVTQAWPAGHEGFGTLVAVIDTGVDLEHPDLAANIDRAHAVSFVASESTALDYNGHGTHVAGIIAAARNGVGIAGVAPRSRILPIKVLDAQGQGDDLTVMRGIAYAVAQGASVINLSLEGLWSDDAAGRRLRRAYESAIRHAEARGALVVVAAGNDGMNVPASGLLALPAQAPGTLTVGAVGPVQGVNPTGIAIYSNYGPGFVDLVAPGGGFGFDPATGLPVANPGDLILSTWSRYALPRVEMGYVLGPSPYMFFGGTSMACAYASGVAALARGAAGPISPERLRQRLQSAGDHTGDASHYGRGVLDALRAEH